MNASRLISLWIGAILITCSSVGGAAQILGGTDSQCITVPQHGGDAPDGTLIRIVECRNQSNQQWIISHGQISGFAGKCLDVQGSAAQDGALVVAVSCSGAMSQQWTLANGQFVGIGGKCISVATGPTFRAPLILSTCSTSPAQQWSVP
jgi:hypothetical protein